MKEEIAVLPDRHIHHSGGNSSFIVLTLHYSFNADEVEPPGSAHSDRRAARLLLYVRAITAEPRICSICFYLLIVRFSLG